MLLKKLLNLLVKPIIVEISKIKISEDNVLVIKFPAQAPHDMIEFCEHRMAKDFPDLRALIYREDDAEISVIHKEA